ncbi:MAG: sialate O-acetylesterase, partial [Bacteroidota bacterium]|nr:sialate O-acetylesterase [Bacteroidota bacterium]
KGIGYSGPTFKSMTTTGGKIKIEFDHAANGLTAYGKELSCFEVAGNDKTFYPAKASISGSSVILTSEEVKDPVSVRYAFKDFIVGDLYNTEGLPASSFRTDNWEK